MRNVLIGAAILVAVGLLLLALYAFRPEPVSPDDADARRIVEVCAGGLDQSGKTALTAALTRPLRAFKTKAAISSAQIGAVISKIVSNDAGSDMYKDYTHCIAQQTEYLLQTRHVRIFQESAYDVDSLKLNATGTATSPPVSLPKASASASAGAPCSNNQTTGKKSPIICKARDVVISGN